MKRLLTSASKFMALALCAATALLVSTTAFAHAPTPTHRRPAVVVTHAPVSYMSLQAPYEGRLLNFEGQWWTVLDGAYYPVEMIAGRWIIVDGLRLPVHVLRLANAYGYATYHDDYRVYRLKPRMLERRHRVVFTRGLQQHRREIRRNERLERQHQRNQRLLQRQERREDRREDRREERRNENRNERRNDNGRGRGRI